MKETTKTDSKGQQIYRVRVYKDFDFPSFSINKNNRLEDVSYKALAEARENILNSNEDYLNFEIINILPFSLKTKIEDTTRNTDYDFFIREIALESLRSKYGEVSHETNPSLFVKVAESPTQVIYNLIEEAEAFYHKEVKRYTVALNNKLIRH